MQTGYAATWDGRGRRRRGAGRAGRPAGHRPVYDGSGLSRGDRLGPGHAGRRARGGVDGRHPNLVGLQHGSLPVAGRTGTLAPNYLRYITKPTRCAAGLIEAKTGSLSGVISLSGFARGADGR